MNLNHLYMSTLDPLSIVKHLELYPATIPTTGTPGVGGAKGGTGLIKPSYAFNGFNGTGWDTINLFQYR